MSTPLILPEYARGPILTQHSEDGRYVLVVPSYVCDRETECETCHDTFEDRGHPVRTYVDASDAIALCDECVRDTASECELVEDPDDTRDVIPASDFLSWADFDTVESIGHDGSGRDLY